MKLFYTISNKYKTAFLLLIIISIVLLTSFWGKTTVAKINKSFSSIYADRLIPANELFHITDLMYQKRLIMAEYLDEELNNSEARMALLEISNDIDSIIIDYEKTYLVDEEDKSLASFKSKVQQYNSFESEILLNNENTEINFQNEMVPIFNDIRNDLITLSQIQTEVGRELMNSSNQMTANTSLIHYCQLGIVLIILLIIQSIIFSAKSIIPKKPQKYTLN